MLETALCTCLQGLTCDGTTSKCIMQWHWLSGNSCDPPNEPVKYGDASVGTCGAGGAYPEEFWNCADIRILPQGVPFPSASPPPPPPPPAPPASSSPSPIPDPTPNPPSGNASLAAPCSSGAHLASRRVPVAGKPPSVLCPRLSWQDAPKQSTRLETWSHGHNPKPAPIILPCVCLCTLQETLRASATGRAGTGCTPMLEQAARYEGNHCEAELLLGSKCIDAQHFLIRCVTCLLPAELLLLRRPACVLPALWGRPGLQRRSAVLRLVRRKRRRPGAVALMVA